MLPSAFLVIDSALHTIKAIPPPVLYAAGLFAAARIGWILRAHIERRAMVARRFASIRV